jgi:predicted enzyme related to lactoylglutathione lyase
VAVRDGRDGRRRGYQRWHRRCTYNGDANRVTVYTAVDDPQAYLDKAESLGATTLMPVTDIGGMVIAMFRDPGGNITGLVKDSA